MKRGEVLILATIGVVVAGIMARNAINLHYADRQDQGIPFYSTADQKLARAGADLYRSNHCRQCHSLWSVKNPFESVPAPALDGIGSLRSEEWFYHYFSAPDPQSILPSRLKAEYRMPSYRDPHGGGAAHAGQVHGQPQGERLVPRGRAGRRI